MATGPRLPLLTKLTLSTSRCNKVKTSAHNRSFASSSPHEAEKEYLVIVPDHPNRLQTRQETKQAHIDGATPLIKNGSLCYFGVTLVKHLDTGSKGPLDINGSLIVMKASSEAHVREFLAADAYTRKGVWDVANARIVPFKAG